MARVRGRDLADAISFVLEGYGARALDQVSAELPPETRSAFAGPIRPADWYPLKALLDFLSVASRLLAGGSIEFCTQQGRFAAERQKTELLGPLVESREMRIRMAPTVWRMFHDVGRLEVVGDTPEAASRIHGFPATAESCARFLGIWEGIASAPGRPAIAEETRCVRRGDAYCEIRVRYPDA